MVWRFPSNKNPVPDVTPWTEEVTNEKLNQVHRRLCSSTYQNDYLGIPQGRDTNIICSSMTNTYDNYVGYNDAAVF